MSKRQEANAHCQSREGQRLLSRRRQVPQGPPQAAAEVTCVTVMPLHGDQLVPRQDSSWTLTGFGTQEDSLECGHSLPHSGEMRLSVSDLPPLHGPPLTVIPPCWLSPERPRTALARVKMPPLPAAPAASGSSPRGRAWSVGPMDSGYRDLVPPSPWGTVAADGAQVTPSPDSSAERLWRGSVARQGHHLPPLQRRDGVPLRTGTQPAWKHLGHSEMHELTEVQEEHGGNTYGDPFRGLAPCLCEQRSTKSTCTQEQPSVCQEAGAKPQVMHRAPSLNEDFTEERGSSSEPLSLVWLPEQQSVSDNSQCLETSPKETEEKWEEDELPESAREENSDPQCASLAPLKEEEAEAATSTLDKDLWDEGQNENFSMSEPQETSHFSASPSFGSPCEEKGTHQLPEQTTRGKLLCTEPEDASKHLLHIKAEELEKLEEDILCSLDQESPLVPHSLCHRIRDCAGETENYSQLLSPDLFEEMWSPFNKDVPSWDTQIDQLLAKWEEELPDRDTGGEGDSKPESIFSLPLQDEEAESATSPLDSDPCDEGHSETPPTELPEDTKMFVFCASPAHIVDDADVSGMQAGRAQEKPCEAEPPAGPCPEPAQPLARRVPACPTSSAAVPQPPAPRRWRSAVKSARRALRRLFSFSCLRGQPEERARCRHQTNFQR